MKAYKVFRVENGKLYSAFEGSRISPKRKLLYKEGKLRVDPKPDKGCTGLMVLLDRKKASEYLRACSQTSEFVLHGVEVLEVSNPNTQSSTYQEVSTDQLTVGKRLESNQKARTKEKT